MLFNSLAFVVFLPAVLVGVGLLPHRWRNAFLLAASYVFYGAWDWRFLGLILLTTSVDYWVSHRIHAARDPVTRYRALLFSVGTNLGILGFFKYFNFFVGSATALLQSVGVQTSGPTLSILLPVGISFYTFQSMSYVVDVYRREIEPVDRFRDYALYVAYFPQLVAGPIERATHLLPQLLAPAPVTAERVHQGLLLMLIGFTKKVLIADTLAPEVERIFSDPSAASAGLLLKGVYFFSFQIYCDFAGYSDIARGVSELFGVRLRINFNQPYLSRSVTEFWRRWHMSLSSFLRDYLYIPLGGNRAGRWATYRNLILTMLIGGLWHGANWTFVVWGGLHGAYLTVERSLGIRGGDVAPPGRRPVSRLIRTVLTFHLAAFAFIFFRAPSFDVAFDYVVGLARLTDLGAVGVEPFLVAAAILAIDVPQNASGDHLVFARLPWWVQSPAYAGVCLALILWGGQNVPFIYFQF